MDRRKAWKILVASLATATLFGGGCTFVSADPFLFGGLDPFFFGF